MSDLVDFAVESRLFVNGSAHGWRLDYRGDGRRRLMSLGLTPTPRWRKADEARSLIAQGFDPMARRKRGRQEKEEAKDIIRTQQPTRLAERRPSTRDATLSRGPEGPEIIR